MAGRGNPWDVPEWHFVRQEAMLVRHLIGAGATALGQANYANKKGEYYRAFFELSVGMERLAKLILVGDYALSNGGALPDESYVRRYGHLLGKLFSEVERVSSDHALSLNYQRPTDPVATAIIANLDAFADAKRGRYANFNAIGDPKNDQHEPIAKWWAEVAEAILKQRYYGQKIQQTVEGNARIVSAIYGGNAAVLHTTETRDVVDDLELSSRRTGQTKLVQKWSRYHALTIARWLADVFCELTWDAAQKHGMDAFYGSWEFLYTYRVEDDLLKSRKIWPLN